MRVWLTEGLLCNDGFAGFAAGLKLLHGLLEKFWDTVYPQIDEGDLELRAAPLEWMGLPSIQGKSTLSDFARKSPLNLADHGWSQYTQSRAVGYEDQAKTPEQKKKRDKDLKEGKLTPEAFDKSFKETPKPFYLELEKQLDAEPRQPGCVEALFA